MQATSDPRTTCLPPVPCAVAQMRSARRASEREREKGRERGRERGGGGGERGRESVCVREREREREIRRRYLAYIIDTQTDIEKRERGMEGGRE